MGLTLEGGTNIKGETNIIGWDQHWRVGPTLEGGTNIRGLIPQFQVSPTVSS